MTESHSPDPFDELLSELEENSENSENSENAESSEDIKAKAQSSIMRYLARREYSKQELQQRLAQKGFSKEIIHDLLAELEDDDWQSDRRCAEMLLSHGYKSNWGPNKIRAQMQQKGIKSNLIAEVFMQFEDRHFNYKMSLSPNNGLDDLKGNQSTQGHQYNQFSHGNKSNQGDQSNQNQIQILQEIIDSYTPNTTDKAAQLDMLDLQDGDWCDKALAAAIKKFGVAFGHPLEKNIKNKAKLQRFLYNRGFESEHISFVIKNYNS